MAKSGSVTKARGGSSRTPTIAAVAVLIVLAAAVFGGIFYTQSSGGSGASAAPIPISPVQASYTTSLQGNVIVAGSGPQVVDLYEDAQCPVCQQFEQAYGQKITDGLNANRLTVRYHMVNLLDDHSTPAGYSSLGGNALMCAAANSTNGSAFPTLHKTLYDHQPPENGAGLTTQQLVDAGAGANAGPGYAPCVQNGTYKAGVASNFQQAQSDPALQQTSGGSTSFGTPTLAVGGKLVPLGTPEMDQALS